MLSTRDLLPAYKERNKALLLTSTFASTPAQNYFCACTSKTLHSHWRRKLWGTGSMGHVPPRRPTFSSHFQSRIGCDIRFHVVAYPLKNKNIHAYSFVMLLLIGLLSFINIFTCHCYFLFVLYPSHQIPVTPWCTAQPRDAIAQLTFFYYRISDHCASQWRSVHCVVGEQQD